MGSVGPTAMSCPETFLRCTCLGTLDGGNMTTRARLRRCCLLRMTCGFALLKKKDGGRPPPLSGVIGPVAASRTLMDCGTSAAPLTDPTFPVVEPAAAAAAAPG